MDPAEGSVNTGSNTSLPHYCTPVSVFPRFLSLFPRSSFSYCFFLFLSSFLFLLFLLSCFQCSFLFSLFSMFLFVPFVCPEFPLFFSLCFPLCFHFFFVSFFFLFPFFSLSVPLCFSLWCPSSSCVYSDGVNMCLCRFPSSLQSLSFPTSRRNLVRSRRLATAWLIHGGSCNVSGAVGTDQVSLESRSTTHTAKRVISAQHCRVYSHTPYIVLLGEHRVFAPCTTQHTSQPSPDRIISLHQVAAPPHWTSP